MHLLKPKPDIFVYLNIDINVASLLFLMCHFSGHIELLCFAAKHGMPAVGVLFSHCMCSVSSVTLCD